MALAVEGSAVVLIGVSRAYKESSNCRMEAQYAFQKKKAIVPLKLTDGYEADGWLGLLLGTSMWYGFYGDTLSSGTAFESRMDALSREIGSRGRADAIVEGVGSRLADAIETVDAPEPAAEIDTADTDQANLRTELAPLRVRALKKRALAEGLDSDAVEDALDEDNSKAALIELIVTVVQQRGPADRLLSCLSGGGDDAADAIGRVLDTAM
eukprot:COSAG02_NODE_26485_length_631_cov_14161.900376_1_plen_210_part_11